MTLNQRRDLIPFGRSAPSVGVTPPALPAPSRLLLIEADEDLRRRLVACLAREGYQADQAGDGHSGLHLGLTRQYDLMIIDRKLPALDGIQVVTRLRSRTVPSRILVLTDIVVVEDRIAVLDAGADAYLCKPFETAELVAAVRALHRRATGSAEAVRIGDGYLELAVRDVVWPDGRRIPLSEREFALLRTLALRPHAVHTRAELRRSVFGDATAASIVGTYVYYLRRKLGRKIVRTVHGLGYQLGTIP
ncbi:response regulator transcription factor [Paractinoplanes toevensis]|uniref:Transcriptional regulator n=1 Tax=Paractinoplanes toevensis TaxID=571911 RepID=A0A919TCE0_9ACTN|nr:response regulator transcription factor [Actinoplanes toevensis]GIM93023.1 transcriptional regulator [Actinoplanes toevensis]